MTSLFRRGSSNNGGGQLNNSRPNQLVRRIEFNQAMDDFKTMFPSMDCEVIECVLRSNNGAVDATIDQLLQMTIDGQCSDDSSDSDDSVPAELLERTLEPDSSDEEPPPVYSPPARDVPPVYSPPARDAHLKAPATAQHQHESRSAGDQQGQSYRNWNPPLLGNLPDDFLRILPQQSNSFKCFQSSMSQPPSSKSSIDQWTAQSGSGCGAVGTADGPSLLSEAAEQDGKLKQYLEDERIALFLQNEEFMRELQRNHDFLMALERDRLKYESKKSKSTHLSGMDPSTGDQYSAVSVEAASDDALFRDKLSHMGKSTRKKLFEIARSFSERTKRRKSKRMLMKLHSLGTANSTVNLLEDDEENPIEEDGLPRRANTDEESEQRSQQV